jgi:hypothetical protein
MVEARKREAEVQEVQKEEMGTMKEKLEEKTIADAVIAIIR